MPSLSIEFISISTTCFDNPVIYATSTDLFLSSLFLYSITTCDSASLFPVYKIDDDSFTFILLNSVNDNSSLPLSYSFTFMLLTIEELLFFILTVNPLL
ncbi:hypothetical protein KGF42_03520 [Clostridioides sp. ZZV15-6383]|uniref:hypothetical protein n=1 Tax=Clostridioides sp. ZZV15-6383 TaxID=2811498 RepID=UPI001D11F7C3|nr:hypothetical protein [Clostridioides sp. ZZV15-6383]